ncbi:FAD:protein FMN transferase [Ottowia sp.]|uniref:FAD:protein FMN transferase n=1 Tax=Ottowia sp. TaxID=1898956 RepID=UPI003A89E26A
MLASALAGAALTPLIPLPVLAAPAPQRFRRTLLGTVVDITVVDTANTAAFVAVQVDQAFHEMQRLEGLMSRFDPRSPLSQINAHAGGQSVVVAPELMAVLQTAQQRATRTEGAFNPVLGQLTMQADPGAKRLDDAFVRRMLPAASSAALELEDHQMRARLNTPLARLDLGGIAKLSILNAGLQKLQGAGISGCLINGGGDVLATARADGQPWRIGIRDAVQPDQLLAIIPLRKGVLASSGDYERFATVGGQRVHHIINPATGRSTRGLRGVTLMADYVDEVNGFGPAAMVVGPSQAMQKLQQWGVANTLLMGPDTAVQISPALQAQLEPAPGQTQIRPFS